MALHITAHLGIANFSSPNGWINRFKERHNILYRKLSCDSRSVERETVDHEKITDYSKKFEVMTSVIYITDQIGPFFNLQLRKIFTF
jgi:hypothetical protein